MPRPAVVRSFRSRYGAIRCNGFDDSVAPVSLQVSVVGFHSTNVTTASDQTSTTSTGYDFDAG